MPTQASVQEAVVAKVRRTTEAALDQQRRQHLTRATSDALPEAGIPQNGQNERYRTFEERHERTAHSMKWNRKSETPGAHPESKAPPPLYTEDPDKRPEGSPPAAGGNNLGQKVRTQSQNK
ncbi:hypothetical protein NDU88_006325 [Pleurodeles waltl]|uniref:Uncharacterized protein n=1 Tax=Pleurodeles waltl TaxID=8319 RepID=A0AAV7LRP3_PLEWA|nr:hypothetical protein NDU88_006325 [Pleurodeles waltl]